MDASYDSATVFCGKNPIHILSVERVSSSPSEYNWEPYGQQIENMPGMMFDRYHYCQANGSILVPMYSFQCDEASGQQNLVFGLHLVQAQTLKQ